MTETPTRADVLVDALVADADAAYAAHAEKRIAVLEAERDEALATLAAARAMLSATGAALAEATKRIALGEAERDVARIAPQKPKP